MPSLPSSNFDSNRRIIIAIDVLTWIFRILVGALFIFSGFVKAIDPWGSIYKFEDYFRVLEIPSIHSLLLSGVFILCAFEFLVGICIISGSYRKSSPIVALCFMCFMLPLTFWIAISNPVKDCGCFGDFFIISNWATFWKNVILTLMIVWLIKFNKHILALITPAFQWIGVVFTIGYIGFMMLFGYFDQPLLDFRPFPAGSNLITDQEDEEDDNYLFIYEKDGVKKEFAIHDIPMDNEGWTFIGRESINPGFQKSHESSFRIWDLQGEEDMTDFVISPEGKIIIITIPDLATVSPATTWKINELYDYSVKNDIEMIAVIYGSSDSIAEWTDLSMPQYELYTSDDTAIKELVRGNPGVVFVENGIIKWKRSLASLDADLLSENGVNHQFEAMDNDNSQTLLNITLLYLCCLTFLIAISLVPRLNRMFTRGDKVRS